MNKGLLLCSFLVFCTTITFAQIVIENFDTKSLGIWTYEGNRQNRFSSTATIPGQTQSGFVGYIVTDSLAGGFNYIQYTLTGSSFFNATTVSALKNGTWKLKMNISTQAPPGRKIKIRLENNSLTNSDNLWAANAEYEAITTLGGISNLNKWETLYFGLPLNESPIIPDDKVNSLRIFFDFLGFDAHSYYFDNLEIVESSRIVTGDEAIEHKNDNLKEICVIYPNPSHISATIQCETSKLQDLQVSLVDVVGKEIIKWENHSSTTPFTTSLDVSALMPGIYYISFVQKGSVKFFEKFVIE